MVVSRPGIPQGRSELPEPLGAGAGLPASEGFGAVMDTTAATGEGFGSTARAIAPSSGPADDAPPLETDAPAVATEAAAGEVHCASAELMPEAAAEESAEPEAAAKEESAEPEAAAVEESAEMDDIPDLDSEEGLDPDLWDCIPD